MLNVPCQFVRDRCLVDYDKRSRFVARSTLFQDLVIRCVKVAFRTMPASVGRVFFSEEVSWPFLRFRMACRGRFRLPFVLEKIDNVQLDVDPNILSNLY